jgi:hypothetical protein
MKENLRTLLPYLARYRRRLALGGAALLVKDLMHASLPIFIGRGVDAMRGDADQDHPHPVLEEALGG